MSYSSVIKWNKTNGIHPLRTQYSRQSMIIQPPHPEVLLAISAEWKIQNLKFTPVHQCFGILPLWWLVILLFSVYLSGLLLSNVATFSFVQTVSLFFPHLLCSQYCTLSSAGWSECQSSVTHNLCTEAVPGTCATSSVVVWSSFLFPAKKQW